jgi:DNA mismatch endonuclease, patch repair protein
MDRVSPKVRSQMMSRIISKNTTPEKPVRAYLHALGFRYALHSKKLPGTPDLVFWSRRACLFVHGCFWHGCRRCVDGTREIGSNRKYWLAKIRKNRARDRTSIRTLRHLGWRVFVVWECQIADQKTMQAIAWALKSLKPRPWKAHLGITASAFPQLCVVIPLYSRPKSCYYLPVLYNDANVTIGGQNHSAGRKTPRACRHPLACRPQSRCQFTSACAASPTQLFAFHQQPSRISATFCAALPAQRTCEPYRSRVTSHGASNRKSGIKTPLN